MSMMSNTAANQIDEIVALVLSHLRGMWRYRWHAVALAWLLCAAGWLAVCLIPDRYQSNADLYVDTRSMVRAIVGDITFTPDVLGQVTVVTRALVTRPQLERVARDSLVSSRITTPTDAERIVGELQQNIVIYPTGQDIYRISYQDRDPVVAFSVVETLLKAFIEDTLGKKRSDAGEASEFIDAQVAEYEQRLQAADARLAEFKRTNLGMMPSESGDYYKRLQSALGNLERLKSDLAVAQRREAELRRQLGGEEPTFGLMLPTSRGPGSALDGRIAQYEAQIEDLKLRYTDQHPDIIALQATVERLRAQRDAEAREFVPTFGAGSSGDSLATNPVHQQLRLSLSGTELEIATLTERIAESQLEVDELRSRVDAILEVERQLASLNRDYNVTRDQYETLLRKRETLHMTGEVEASGSDVNFQIIEPPRIPSGPVAPTRGLFFSAVLVMALASGVVLAFFLDQIFPVYTSSRDLRVGVGLPVLGSISRALSPVEKKRRGRDRLLFAASVAGLFLGLGAATLLASSASRAIQGLLGLTA